MQTVRTRKEIYTSLVGKLSYRCDIAKVGHYSTYNYFGEVVENHEDPDLARVLKMITRILNYDVTFKGYKRINDFINCKMNKNSRLYNELY